MKLFLVGFAFVAVAAASSYIPPAQDSLAEYNPNQELSLGESNNQFIAPGNEYLAPFESVEPIEQLSDDGYRYKTVKRLRHRNRRDVSELSSSAQYLPPVQQESGYDYPAPAPVEIAAPTEVAEPVDIPAPVEITAPLQNTAELADDGYRYKTVKRIRYRHRRDVNELPNEYLPPQELSLPEPNNQYLAPVEGFEPIEQLADDGYRYKTVKRLRHRNRRDVSELPTDYLPPQELSLPEPTNQYLAPAEGFEPIEQLADDGYRYKTVKRLRHRNRRDVSELPTEYLPPQELSLPEPSNEYLAPVEGIEQLADDGYRYKTVKRLRHRNRRDVNELSSAQYLPPVEEHSGYNYPAPVSVAAPAPLRISAPVAITAPIDTGVPIQTPEPIVESAQLADDGYHYKTVRRIRYRQRRDVNELPTSDYLPPIAADAAPIQTGYSYPAPAPVEISAPIEIEAPVEEQSAQLADDGYRYKTVRRIRYRHRRDVNELPTEYLPPQEVSFPEPSNQYLAPIEGFEPIEQLADDGYRYKTVKRLRHRNRRDVNELAQYLPPVQQESGYSYAPPAPVEIPAPEEIPSPIEAPVEVAAPIEIAEPVQETAELASDGYRYKTVKRIRYRHRRDVNELLSGEYLPPGQELGLPEPSNEYLSPAIEQPIEQIGVDGYRYKTVKKYKIKRN